MDWFLYDKGLRHERVMKVSQIYLVFFISIKRLQMLKPLQM